MSKNNSLRCKQILTLNLLINFKMTKNVKINLIRASNCHVNLIVIQVIRLAIQLKFKQLLSDCKQMHWQTKCKQIKVSLTLKLSVL